MAVRLADYYATHVRLVIYFAAAVLLAINVVLTIVLTQLGIDILGALLYIVMPVVLLETFACMLVGKFALEPLEILTRAITHVSHQDNAVVPPPINEPRLVKSGLKDMAQTVYDLSLQDKTTPAASPAPLDGADALPCGIIGLNTAHEIVYANSRAPVVTNAQNQRFLKLRFEENDSLTTWLAAAAAEKLKDEHVWTHIADDSPDRPERRLYDVIAYYEKNAPDGIETRLVTVDKTGLYSDDEEAVDFISVAAHELRGPITVIRGYLDVLLAELAPMLQGDQKQLIDRLDVSASRLSGYINNILNVAKYDRSHLKLHLQEDSLYNIYATIADDLQLRASTQNRLLSFAIPTTLPTIAADRSSLTEVLANLVDNAIKYSHEGGHITVTATVDGAFVRCAVQDQGIGIPASVVGNLFSKFYRSHRSRSSVAGTGLGLYISRAIVESHGGKIGVTSREGEGSTFFFSLPIYSTVADKLAAGNNGNEGIIETSSGWIKNHSKIGG